MKLQLLTFSSLLMYGLTFGQNQAITNYDQGIFNGGYKSVYPNGKTKAEGNFENNQRVGTWKVYDSLGNIRMVREYNNSQFKIVESFNLKKEKNKTLKFVPNPTDRNAQGYISYSELKMYKIAFSKRVWREILPTPINNKLFADNELYQTLVKQVQKKELVAYSPASDEFKILLEKEEIEPLKDLKVVKYKIKEDWFYDAQRQTGEYRIVGICPVVNVKGKEVDAFWVFYPEARGILSQLNAIDDLFYFRNFNSAITKVSNVNDRFLSEYTAEDDMEKAILNLEIELLEVEHDYWIKATE